MNLLHHSYARGASLRFRPGSLLVIVVVSNEEGDAMTNEIIGIVGTIGLTLLLFVLRHLILPSERANKGRRVTPMTHRENNELKKTTVEDDARLLWTPDIEVESGTARRQSSGPRGQRRKEPGYDQRHDDRTVGGEIR